MLALAYIILSIVVSLGLIRFNRDFRDFVLRDSDAETGVKFMSVVMLWPLLVTVGLWCYASDWIGKILKHVIKR